MRSRIALLCVAIAVFPACGAHRTPLAIPTFSNGGMLQGSTPVPAASLAKLAAVYTVSQGGNPYGSIVVAKVTGSALAIYSLVNYSILQAGCLQGGTKLVLEGYWRAPTGRDIGLSRYFVSPDSTAAALCAGSSISSLPKAALQGTTGNGQDESLPMQVGFAYKNDLVDVSSKFSIIAHHGACRTIDECGFSENSVESIRQVETFGADRVEIDVRLTSDHVPILFHDDTFNERLVNGQFCHGNVSGMPLAAVRTFCRLAYGEGVPTLDEALAAAVNDTTLKGVWLDMKVPEAVGPAATAIQTAQALAATKGRTIDIFIGLPDADTIAAYQTDGASKPCLVEEDSADVTRLGCQHWGPRFTRGSLLSEVRSLQAASKSVYFWTINDIALMDLFMATIHPDAFITDRAGLAFHIAQFDSAAILAGP